MILEPIKIQIEDLHTDVISSDRKIRLLELSQYIQAKFKKNQIVNLNFICTHNSRRSHLAQIWGQTMAAYYDIPNVFCYSGGTEVTALYPAIAETLIHTGFEIETLSMGNNPIYSIKFSKNNHPVIGFSKTYDAAFNPTSEFAAILTCSNADKGCPYISGTEKRLQMTYEDPKIFDGTPLQDEKYLERSLQIATDMKYVFANLKY